MKKIRAYIQRNMTHKAPAEFPEYELPILRAIHGREAIEVVAEVEVERKQPSVLEEAERLTNRYGAEENTGVPFFVKVYGAEEIGLERLAEAMKKAWGGRRPVMENAEMKVSKFENPEMAVKGSKKAAA